MKIAVTGATGFIGGALTSALEAKGHEVLKISRSAGPGVVQWNPTEQTIDAAALEGVDGVVHLAGEGIANKRWSDSQKAAIRDSRRLGTNLIATTIANLDAPPKVLLSGSAIGYYGDGGDTELTEESPAGDDFLADVCVDWEEAAAPAVDAGITVSYLRTGIVLGADGGVFKRLRLLYKAALGGKLGDGSQYMSWISIQDQVGAMVHLLENPKVGPFNLTGPAPVTNAVFNKAMGKALGRPAVIPVPKFGPRLLLGKELADALLFTSARVLPEALQDHGYEFQHQDIHSALAAQID